MIKCGRINAFRTCIAALNPRAIQYPSETIEGIVWTGVGKLDPEGSLYVVFEDYDVEGTWKLLEDGKLKGTWQERGTNQTGVEVWTPK